MRKITTHHVNPANQELQVLVMDAPGAGGANHCYHVLGFNTASNPSGHLPAAVSAEILFQNGPIPEAGVNGLTHEVLLAIVADRLESFQAGPYACVENAAALVAVRDALDMLKKRTQRRIQRGVEGTHQV